ncbi:hypothetical protein [Streptomyces sp. NPDC060022]|uniref:hypothetical protein n=1 Tax=Streptomyces sp. NPDC060022 TaxID=3347039 RepID=UPI0036B033D6
MDRAPAHTYLLVPASRCREELWDTAEEEQPDAVILDIYGDEAGPEEARAAAVDWLKSVRRTRPRQVWFRVHPVSGECAADLAAFEGLGNGVVLPEVATAREVSWVTSLCPATAVMPVFETHHALSRAVSIACRPGVVRLGLSIQRIDEQLPLDVPERRDARVWARSILVNASAAAGLPGPVNGIHPTPEDVVAVAHDAVQAADEGFTAQCINRGWQLCEVRILRREWEASFSGEST